ncbi:MAG: hypothetical protein JOY61_21305 [Chloroflexi bacterium]|nr:hypothetical protein [Chloroflexota bacterium]
MSAANRRQVGVADRWLDDGGVVLGDEASTFQMRAEKDLEPDLGLNSCYEMERGQHVRIGLRDLPRPAGARRVLLIYNTMQSSLGGGNLLGHVD